ncbi:LacI family DNA-binding transcriptional regulator [uncultured Victivallis sp.]|uniref:LacI family DNA-binding transcriptional regulator n=1 Tax=uncultured Victivallis sp. TaxID=354118 RepID=UPI0025FEFFF5|nr:LacI family DNA-binding transcriptional regulator [uncultured Victivallis sp.]
MSKRVTIQDVADYLKVSKSAVSHALSKRRRISPELSRRVQAAIDELGYKPDFAAQVLNSRSTGLIGVVIGELENPHTITLVNELSRRLKESGYSLTLCLCESKEPEECRNFVGRIPNGMVDAIINMLPALSADEAQAAAGTTPVLTYRRHRLASVTLDYEHGVIQALDHLTGLGHTRIGIISVSKLYYGMPDPRVVAYRNYMTARGLFDPALVIPSAGDTVSGGEGAAALFALPERPTAILAGNDLTASGVFQWAYEHGVRLPEELSVIGFDNSPLARALYPRLTSVDTCVPQIADHTARVLLSLIGGKAEAIPPIEIKPNLVIRNSCCSYQR